jgi:hypothetical protein
MVFDALPLSYGGDIVFDSTPFNVQFDGRGLPGWVGGWVARDWKRSCTVSAETICGSRPTAL